jgi:hypothetical protein
VIRTQDEFAVLRAQNLSITVFQQSCHEVIDTMSRARGGLFTAFVVVKSAV